MPKKTLIKAEVKKHLNIFKAGTHFSSRIMGNFLIQGARLMGVNPLRRLCVPLNPMEKPTNQSSSNFSARIRRINMISSK